MAQSRCSEVFPDRAEIEKLVAGHPDARQIIAIIARSYDYIRALPLAGLRENYPLSLRDLQFFSD
jgi:hypothetical protein